MALTAPQYTRVNASAPGEMEPRYLSLRSPSLVIPASRSTSRTRHSQRCSPPAIRTPSEDAPDTWNIEESGSRSRSANPGSYDGLEA